MIASRDLNDEVPPLALQPLIEYYGLKDEFPVSRQLISRSLEVARPKRLYFVTTEIFDVIIRDERELLKIAATGLKVRFRLWFKPFHGLLIGSVFCP